MVVNDDNTADVYRYSMDTAALWGLKLRILRNKGCVSD